MIVHNLSNQTVHKDLDNSILVRSNSNIFVEFTNCNLPRKFVELALSTMAKNQSFPITVPNRPQNLGQISIYNHLSFTDEYG